MEVLRGLLITASLAAGSAVAQPQPPGAELIDTVEVLPGRDASTRVWENVYEVPVLDATGQPTGQTEERRGQFVEVGTGLCYDARTPEEREAGAPPEWQPTDSDWVIAPGGGLSVETGPIAVRLGSNLTAPGHVRIGEGETALPLSVVGLAMQDTATGQLHLIEAPRDVEPEVEGNRVLYAGALTAGDIEYVYEPSGFKQNLILRNRAALPDPATLGMNPATTIVGLASLMDLEAQPHRLVAELASADLASPSGVIAAAAGDAAADGSQLVEVAPLLAESGAEAVIAEAAPLRVVSDAGETVLTFRAGEAWDSAEGLPNASPVTESVSRLAGNTVLLDSVPYEWLLAAELPVTIDYQAFGGNQSPRNLTFVRGVTYYISSDLVVGSGQTLAIEPGAVVKLDGGTESIIIDHGGQIIAEGEPYDPIHFLRADYNTVNPSAPIGESIPGAGTGRSAAMIIINGNSTSTADRTNQSIIRHCRFSGGVGCVSLVGNMNRADNPIFDCIFRDYFSAVSIITSSSGSQSQTQEIINCLFAPAIPGAYEAQAYTGIEVSTRDADTVNVTTLFCTFNGHRDASVSVGTPAGQLSSNSTVNFDLQYNCLTSSSPGYEHLIDARAGTGLGGSASPYQYNAYDDTDVALFEGPLFQNNPGSNAQTRGTFPTSGNGLFYQNGLMNLGAGVSGAGVAGLTTEAPVAITGNITAAATWSPANSGVELDEDEDDIGYHYPAAHYHLSNAVHSVTADLTVAPGTVLSYGGAAAAITANTANARLTVDGGPGADDLVRCYPHTSVGDFYDDVTGANYASAFTFGLSAPRDSSVQGALIAGAASGVRVETRLPVRGVENCRFIDCDRGIYRISTGSGSEQTTQFDARNNLFLRCQYGLDVNIDGAADENHVLFCRVEGNTFAHGRGAGRGIRLNDATEENVRTVNLVLESNLFTGLVQGLDYRSVSHDAEYYTVNVVDRSNTYWMNQEDIDSSAQSIFDGVVFADDADLPGGAPGRHNHRQNPMNAHATSGAERRYDSGSGLWGSDGFFLAQADGQASRHPLVLPSGWHLRDTDGITFDHIDDPYGSGTYRVYAGLAAPSALPGDFVNSSSQRLGHRTSADAYTAGSQAGNGVSRVWVALWHEGAATGPPKEGEGGSSHSATFLAEDTRFTLHFTDAGESVEVGLPVALPDLDFYALGISAVWAGWVAMDGSVYDGNSFNPRFVDMQGHPGRSGFDQDADFAMGYDTAGGSGLALSQSEGLGIGSPLVDAGSRDLLNDGFTSPHRTGGIFDEPDNPAAALDFMGSLDAGYHHFGRPRFPRQTVTQVGVPVYEWVLYTIGPINYVVRDWDAVGQDGRFLRFAEAQIDSNREIDIASGHFGQSAAEDNFGEDFTVAVFPTEVIELGPTSYGDPTPLSAIAVAGLPFRGTTGLTAQEVSPAYVGLLTDFGQSTPRGNLTWAELPTEHEERQASMEGYQFHVHDCLAVTACAVPSRGDGDNAGTVYVAAVGRYSSHETDVQEFTYDRILVWRLRTDLAAGALFPDDDDTTGGSVDPPKLEFSPGGFGALQAYTSIPYLREHERIEILDVSLCANNDGTDPGVYVSWIERRDGAARVRSQYVPDSLTQVVLGRTVVGGVTEVDNAFTVDGTVAGGTHRVIAFDEVEQLIHGTQDSVGYTNSLDSDFDFARGEPRLSYFDFHGSAVGTSETSPIGPRQAVLQVHATTLVPFSVRDAGEFNLWYPKASATASAFECYGDDYSNLLYTSLAINHADPASAVRAFSSYTLGASPGTPLVYDLWTQGLAVDGSGNDDWLAPASGATLLRPGAPASDTLHYPDATYRFSGTPRYISAQDLGTYRYVTTNVERILDESNQVLSSGLYPHIATNAVNLVDTFACYVTTSGTGSREVTVIQVDP